MHTPTQHCALDLLNLHPTPPDLLHLCPTHPTHPTLHQPAPPAKMILKEANESTCALLPPQPVLQPWWGGWVQGAWSLLKEMTVGLLVSNKDVDFANFWATLKFGFTCVSQSDGCMLTRDVRGRGAHKHTLPGHARSHQGACMPMATGT